ncbi:MAG: ribosome biogenesis GTPase Der [Geminicoccaceae bacterium]
MSIPTVAILGRPNVGKSTLFNRLIGRRRAIVDDTPGVTRDRIEGICRLGADEFRVIDTAGLELGSAESLAGRLHRQAMDGLAEADVGLFVVDARGGITTADLEIAEELRRQKKPILVLANKCEGRAAEAQAIEAWSLGLGEPVPVSGEHGDGVPDLLAALRPYLRRDEAPAVEEPPAADGDERPDRPLRLAIIGRPNAGKSSLVNRLIAEERMLTGPEPGLTRDSVSLRFTWNGRVIELVDTAGLRKKARVEAKLEKLSTSATLRSLKFADVVALIVDATVPLERQDLTIARLVAQEGRALVVVLNKWDLITDTNAAMSAVRERLTVELADVRGVPCVALSALTGRKVETLLPAVVGAYARWDSRVPTAALNRWLAAALERHPPPLAQGRRVKIRYATQTTARPPTFVLFANKSAEALPDSYLRFLAAGLRDSFDLWGVPIRFHVRHRENPYAPD